ncbi:restriction endonuclease subunit S [Vibrio cincinnatiensis]|uniref:restriction endonuclease subunit S n=1 Tax=Vibrio cholerae TaxID=666 RepID=UPI00157BA60B|nr:restriction endonuclease subunit S [Vibrio cholerae]CAB1255217.1 type I restriction-modification system specificity subunit S [Vibrio cholerae]
MTVENNVPEIRFKGFSEEWANKNIGDIFQVVSGATPLRSDARFFENADVSWVKTTDLNNGIILKTEEMISQTALVETSVKILPKGTVFVAMYGGFNQIGRTGLLETEATCNQALSAIYPNDKIVPYYLLTYLNLNVDAWKDLAASSRKDPNITKSDVLAFPFLYPSFKEQTQIGNTFQKLDNLIKQHQQKHDKLSNIKKAMLNKMFPKQGETIPEIRFKGFSGEWEEKELGSIAQLTMGQSPSGENYTNNPNDFILVQGNADLKNGFVVPRVWTSEATKKAVKGALIFSVRAPVGEVGKTNYDVVLGRGVAAVYGNEFIYQQLQKLKSDNYWHKVSAGSTFDAISSTELASTLIWISSESEQEKIGNYFQKLDTLINQHQQQITKLNNIKQACLSKMFV